MTHTQIGIIGAGKITSFFHLPILKNINGVDIAFVADIRNPQVVARSYNIKPITLTGSVEQLPDCDLVLLATPVSVRESYIREYAKRGTAIFTEKPFAISLESHRSLLAFTDRITCNYHRVTYSSIVQMQQIIASGIFGQLREVRIYEGGIVSKAGKEAGSYQNNLEQSGGEILIESGCHTLSQLASLFQGYQFKVENACVEYQDGFDVDVQAECTLTSGDHSFVLSYDLTIVRPIERYSKYIFDNAVIKFDHTKADASLAIGANNRSGAAGDFEFLLQHAARGVTTNYQAFYEKWLTFIENVRTGVTLDSKVETSIVTSQLINDIYFKTTQSIIG